MSKIDINLPFFPQDSSDSNATNKAGSPLDFLTSLGHEAENVLERFQKVSDLYNNFLQQAAEGIGDVVSDIQGEFSDFEKLLLNARLGGAEIQAGPAGQKSQALLAGGKKVAGDKQEKEEFQSVSFGDLFKDAKVGEKELKNISGVINFNKGTTLWEFDDQLRRLFEMDKSGEGKWGTGNIKGVADFMELHLRLFGEFTASLKDLVLKIGLGAQGAFELISGHIAIKHDAPDVKLSGHDMSLHNFVNLDAYVGAVAEGGALLTLGFADAGEKGLEGISAVLRLGGEAFVGAAASISGAANLGDVVGVSGAASARAGAGAKAILDIGYDKGEFDVKGGIGAAVLIGGSFDWGVSVNVLEIAGLAEDMGKELLENPIEYPVNFLYDVGSILGTNVGTILHFVDDVFGITRKSDNIPSESTTRHDPLDNKINKPEQDRRDLQ